MYSRIDQVNFVEDSLSLGPFLNTLSHLLKRETNLGSSQTPMAECFYENS